MNALYRLLAAVANAVVAVYRWMVAIEEGPGYVTPAVTHHTLSPETQAATWAFPAPELPVKAYATVAWPTVSLIKETAAPNLVRPFVKLEVATRELAAPVVMASMATVRAVAAALDELGLPKAPMATQEMPTVGIFEQTFAAFIRRTGNRNASASWA